MVASKQWTLSILPEEVLIRILPLIVFLEFLRNSGPLLVGRGVSDINSVCFPLAPEK